MTMTAEISHEMDEAGGSRVGSPLWLRRTLVFLLLGPMLGVFAVPLTEAVVGGISPFVGLIMMIVFVFGLQVGALTAIADGILSRILPIALRAPLTAVTAATVGFGSLSAMFGPLPQGMFTPIGGVLAFCAGICSLLSHDYGHSRRQ
jgi:MFS family permease